MVFKLFKKQLHISIIAAGDIGQEIGAELILTLKAGGIEQIHSLALNSGRRSHHTDKIFDRIFSVADDIEGYARRLDDALADVAKWEQKIRPVLQKMIPKQPGLMLLITGGGATGVASILTVAKILKEVHRQTPPILAILPDRFENSRVHHNMATFIYRIVYSNDPIGNNLILIDNAPVLHEYDLPFEQTAKQKIDFVNRAITNLIISTNYDSYREDYEADFDDLYDVLHTPGVSFLVYAQFDQIGRGQERANLRYIDILVDEIVGRSSLNREDVFNARNTYCAILRKNYDNIDFTYEAPRFFQSFQKAPFLKFIKTGKELENELGVAQPSLNAVVSGVPVNPRLIEVFKTAQESRKKVIIDESNLSDIFLELDIDTVQKLEDELNREIVP